VPSITATPEKKGKTSTPSKEGTENCSGSALELTSQVGLTLQLMNDHVFFLSTDMHPQSHKWLQWVIPFRSAGADDGKF
jgi:hypothetical protein